MPHIPLDERLPGIRSIVAYRTDTGREIHHTVLIAAAFSMDNRYVDGLATRAPRGPATYEEMGRRIAEQGYARRFDQVVGAAGG